MHQQMLIAAAGAAVSGTWAKWSTTDKSSLITVSDSDRLATAASGGLTVRTIRATHAVPAAAKTYFEFVLQTFTESNLTLGLGLANASTNVTTQYWASLRPRGLFGVSTSRPITGNTPTPPLQVVFAGQFLVSAVIGVAVDMNTGHIWFAVNNNWIEGNPGAGTGASYTNLSGNGSLFPAASIYTLNDAIRLRANPAEHSYSPPSGFTAGIPG